MLPKRNKKGEKAQDQPPVFHPTIYRYTCTGALFLSSEETGSEGTCRGVRSRLELLSDLQINSRDEAIRDFCEMSEYVLEGEGESESGLDETTKSIIVSPALIYKDDTVRKDKRHLLPEEEIIKRQEWSCYGSTEVEYLVLKDPITNKESICALTPRNNGMSVRRIEAETGNITNIMIGWVSIVLDTSFFGDSDTDEQSSSMNKNSNSNPILADQADDPRTTVDELAAKPTPSALDTAKSAVIKTYSYSLKVIDQMGTNVRWLGENVQDDFPNRMAASGQRIVGNVGKTADRTTKFAEKIFNMFWNPGANDDE
jgi:hypothetical protein